MIEHFVEKTLLCKLNGHKSADLWEMQSPLWWEEMLTITRSSGGIGRHKELKIPRVKPCRFESGLEHQSLNAVGYDFFDWPMTRQRMKLHCSFLRGSHFASSRRQCPQLLLWEICRIDVQRLAFQSSKLVVGVRISYPTPIHCGFIISSYRLLLRWEEWSEVRSATPLGQELWLYGT